MTTPLYHPMFEDLTRRLSQDWNDLAEEEPASSPQWQTGGRNKRPARRKPPVPQALTVQTNNRYATLCEEPL